MVTHTSLSYLGLAARLSIYIISSVRLLRLILNHILSSLHLAVCRKKGEELWTPETVCDLEISRSHFIKRTRHTCSYAWKSCNLQRVFESESNSTVHCKSRCISFVRCQVNWCSSWVASFAAGVKRHQIHRILLPRHLLPGSFEEVIGQRVMLSDVPSWRCKCIQIITNTFKCCMQGWFAFHALICKNRVLCHIATFGWTPKHVSQLIFFTHEMANRCKLIEKLL